MNIRLNRNPGINSAYLKSMAEAVKAGKTAGTSSVSRSRDTVVLSQEARAAYTAQNTASAKTAKQTTTTQTATQTSAQTSAGETGSTGAERVNGIMMKDGKWDDSETTFFWWGDGATKLREDLEAQGKTVIGMYYVDHELAVQQVIRDQISQSVQDLLNKNGITIPEGQSFTMNVSSYDFYIHVDGLDDPELTEAVENAINVGNNGYRLQCHISDCRRLTNELGLTVPSAAESLGEAKESLYYMVQDLTGYDIRELERADGHIFTPDGQDLWDVLLEKASHYQTPDGIMRIDISKYLPVYQLIAQLGWDSVPDPVYQLLYKGGSLYDIGSDYGFGPGQTGWQDWVHTNAEELTAKIMAGADRQIANNASRTYAASRTASVPEKTAKMDETEKEPDDIEKSEEPEEPDESTWNGPWTIPAYGERRPMALPVEKLWLGDGILLEPIRK